jgi:hypothetical protein
MRKKRPCTAEDIACPFGMNFNELSKQLGKLQRQGRIHTVKPSLLPMMILFFGWTYILLSRS